MRRSSPGNKEGKVFSDKEMAWVRTESGEHTVNPRGSKSFQVAGAQRNMEMKVRDGRRCGRGKSWRFL